MSVYVLDPENRILYLENGDLYKWDDISMITFSVGNTDFNRLWWAGLVAGGQNPITGIWFPIGSLSLLHDLARNMGSWPGACYVQMDADPEWKQTTGYGKAIMRVINLDKVTSVWKPRGGRSFPVLLKNFVTMAPALEFDRISEAWNAWKEEGC